jgi:hypothetical protein
VFPPLFNRSDTLAIVGIVLSKLGFVDKAWLGTRSLIQGWLLEAALGERIGVTDEEWEVIGPLLPPEHGRGCRPAQALLPFFTPTLADALYWPCALFLVAASLAPVGTGPASLAVERLYLQAPFHYRRLAL